MPAPVDLERWFGALRLLGEFKSGSRTCRIPIFDERGQDVGHLEPLTAKHIGDPHLIDTFVRWRNQARRGHLDQRPVHPEGTAAWLFDVVTDPLRLANLIYFQDRLVGRAGFVKLTPTQQEADSLVRGERGGGMAFMHWAQMSGLVWGFLVTGSQSVVADIVSDNHLALENCRRLGYENVPFRSRTLYRTATPDGEVWTTAGRPEDAVPDVSLHSYRLHDTAFFRVARTFPFLVRLEAALRESLPTFAGI